MSKAARVSPIKKLGQSTAACSSVVSIHKISDTKPTTQHTNTGLSIRKMHSGKLPDSVQGYVPAGVCQVQGLCSEADGQEVVITK